MIDSATPESTTHPQSTAPQVRVVFMGTPAFAATLLSALLSAQYHVVGVVTQPDRKVGRKQLLTPSPVKALAEEHALPVLQPEKLDDAAYETLSSWQPDLIVVAAYGKILKERFLSLPGLGALNVHTSLLPRWRGASPIQNALLAGDQETGITLMVMDKGMDTGDIIVQKPLPIDLADTLPILEAKLAALAEETLLATLPRWIKRQLKAMPQPNEGATLCQLIERTDGQIIWTDSAEAIYNRYRALTPWPGIYTHWKQDGTRLRLKLLRISLTTSGDMASPGQPASGLPMGQVFRSGERVGVQTGHGIIFLEELQLEGRSRMPITEFLKGNPAFIDGCLQ